MSKKKKKKINIHCTNGICAEALWYLVTSESCLVSAFFLSTVTCDDNPPKKKKMRAYNSVCEKEFSWLEFDESSQVMKCSVCLKTRQKNTLVSGCTNFY